MFSVRCFSQRRLASASQLEPRGSVTPGDFGPLLGLSADTGLRRDSRLAAMSAAWPAAAIATEVPDGWPFRDLARHVRGFVTLPAVLRRRPASRC